MNTRQLEDLKEKLDESYWKNKQHLHIASIEVLDYNSPNSGPFCIYTVNSKTGEFEHFLFEVQNYNSFVEDVPHVDKSILYPEKFDYKWKWDGCRASYAPFYYAKDNVYTIPKFTSITRADILRCFDHFKHKVLDSFLLFNVSWYEFKEGQYTNGQEQIKFNFDLTNHK